MSKLFRLLFSLSFALILFSGCSKEDRVRHRLSGVYEVSKYEMAYYNGHDKPDSTRTINDFGSIGLYDNDINPYNNIESSLQFEPLGWAAGGVGGSRAVGWYGDDVHGKTITFFSELDYSTAYVVYTIEKDGFHKQQWSCIVGDASGKISYKETLYVKRK